MKVHRFGRKSKEGVTRVRIFLGEVETKHLFNRRRGKADVRVSEDGIEFLDAGGRRFVELVWIKGR